LLIDRDDCKEIFARVFAEILRLIKRQIEDVRRITGSLPKVLNLHQIQSLIDNKALLLVGGLGSNAYLRDYLSEHLNERLSIKQPAGGYSQLSQLF
jgi:tRNA A37 threonylcarbamoyltransferase TsaD